MNICKTKILTSLFILFAVLLIVPKHASAGFGISPSDIINDNLKPGSHYEKTITLNRANPDEDLKIKIIPELEEMYGWFKFEPSNEFIMKKGESEKVLNVVIDVPENAELKNYSGNIKVTASPVQQEDGGGVSVVKGAKIMVQLITTDINIADLLIRRIDIPDTKEGEPLELMLLIENVGNVDVAPTSVELEVYNLIRTPVDKYEVTNVTAVKPGVTDEVTVLFDHDLETGEYFGNVKVYIGENLLREEELYFRYGDISAQEETSIAKISEPSLQKDKSMMKDDKISTILLVFTLIAVALLLYIINKKKRNNTIKLIIYLLLLLISILVVVQLVSQKPNQNIEEDVLKQSLSIDDDESILENQNNDNEDYIEEVKGTRVEEEILKSHQYNGKYPIYKEPNLKSEIIYFAQDGDSFDLIEDKGDWILVIVDKENEGWIEKKSIKQ